MALAKRTLSKQPRSQRLSGDLGGRVSAAAEFLMRPVGAAQVKDWWPLVSEGLRIVRIRVKPSWEIEDVYVSLKKGTAVLYVTYRGDQYAGFCVCAPTPDPFQPVTHLFVWAAYSRLPGAVEASLAQLVQEAKQAGFSTITFQSPRKGFAKKNLGFRVKETIYEMRLQDG